MQIQVLRGFKNTCLFIDLWQTVLAADKWSLYSEYLFVTRIRNAFWGNGLIMRTCIRRRLVRCHCFCSSGTGFVVILSLKAVKIHEVVSSAMPACGQLR
jgi:hypothetical protein